MFRFEEIIGVWAALALIPIGFGLWYLHRLHKQQRFQWMRTRFTNLKWILPILLLLVLAFAWANPQWGNRKEKVRSQSADIFILLDISNSMLAEDVAPSRLDRAKRLAVNLMDRLKGDRIGLVFFAGNAFLQMPLSADYAAAQMMTEAADPGMAGSQGTAIDEALAITLESIDPNSRRQRAVVLITDGEDHSEATIAAAKTARNQGVTIFTVGVGTETGAVIPIRTPNGRDVKRDNQGQAVNTAIDLEMVQDIANAGGGRAYQLINESDVLKSLENELEDLQRYEVETQMFSSLNSYYQWLIFLAIIILLIDWVIRTNIMKWK